MSEQKSKQWLLRRPSGPTFGIENGRAFTISGPVRIEDIKAMIRDGRLESDDEICEENGYWFALHETAEVQRHLGSQISLIKKSSNDDEVTEPDLTLETTQEIESSVSVPANATGMVSIKRPGSGGAATVRSKVLVPLASPPDTHVDGQKAQALRVEKSRFWGIIVILGMIAVVIGVLWVLKSLKP